MGLFVGILDGKDDVWGVRVPDVPGANGGGATPEEAIQDAISALCELADEIGGVQPRGAAEVAHDAASRFCPSKGETLVMLPILAASGTPSKANISIDKRQLDAIDEAAKRRGLTRSAFFVEAAIEKIAAECG
jgi:hypothetical protein